MSFRRAFCWIGIGTGFALWAILKNPFWFCVGFFVCLGIGCAIDEILGKKEE